jgi:hypothetical protein
MYVMWVATIIALLATTFTNFQYEDLNLIAAVLLFFAALNSFFVMNQKNE